MAGFVPLRFFLLSPRKPLRRVFAGAPLVLPKKMGRARWKKKPLCPNLPGRASLGMRRLIASFPQIYPVSSRCAVTRLSTYAYAASCHVSSNSRVLVETPYLWPRCRSMGMDSKGRGRSPFLLVVQERGPGGNPAERVSPWPLFGGGPFLSAREMGRICPTPIGVDNLSFYAQL